MKFTKDEFCEKMQIERDSLRVYIQRRQVNLNELGEINDADELNARFIARRQTKLAKKVVGKEAKMKPEKPVKEKPKKPENEAFSRENTNRNELLEMDKEKGKLALEEKRNAIIIQQMEIAKKRGELIPTEIVRKLVVQQSEGTKIAYTEACESLILIFSQKRQLTAVEVSEIRKDFIGIVNTAINTSIDITNRNMTEIVKEFSEKRGVGQHG